MEFHKKVVSLDLIEIIERAGFLDVLRPGTMLPDSMTPSNLTVVNFSLPVYITH